MTGKSQQSIFIGIFVDRRTDIASPPVSIVSHLSSFTIHLNRSSRNLFSPNGSRDRSRPFLGDTCKRPVRVPIRAKQADHLKLQRVSETDLFRRPFLSYYTLNSSSISSEWTIPVWLSALFKQMRNERIHALQLPPFCC